MILYCIAKSLFIVVNASLRCFIILASFLSQSQVDYNCSLIKVDWLDAFIAQSVAGAVLVVFLRRWRTICTVL